MSLGCTEHEGNPIRNKRSTVERLDSAFAELKCPASPTAPPSSSQMEFARLEVVRAKVDPGAAFRAAHAFRLALACARGAQGQEGLRHEAAQAYGLFRSQVARSVLGASRSRALGDRKGERDALVDLAELLRAIVPEDAATAELRIRQIDLESRPR